MGGKIPLVQQLKHNPGRLVAWWDEAVWVVHPLREDGTINTSEAGVYDRKDEKLLAKLLLDEGIIQVQCPSKHLVNIHWEQADRAFSLTEHPEANDTFLCLKCDPPVPVFGFVDGEMRFSIQPPKGDSKAKKRQPTIDMERKVHYDGHQ